MHARSIYWALAISGAAALPLLVFAQTTGDSGFVSLTKIDAFKEAGNPATLPDFLNTIYRICIGLAAVLGVLQIMRAGIVWMTAAGSHEKLGEAKGLIRDALLGLLLVLAPTIVFGIINPEILSLKIEGIEKLNLDKTTAPSGSGSGGAGGGTPVGAASCPPTSTCTALPAGQSCSTVNGSTVAPATYCTGMAAGGVCCVKSNVSAASDAKMALAALGGESLGGTNPGTAIPSDSSLSTGLQHLQTQIGTTEVDAESIYVYAEYLDGSHKWILLTTGTGNSANGGSLEDIETLLGSNIRTATLVHTHPTLTGGLTGSPPSGVDLMTDSKLQNSFIDWLPSIVVEKNGAWTYKTSTETLFRFQDNSNLIALDKKTDEYATAIYRGGANPDPIGAVLEEEKARTVLTDYYRSIGVAINFVTN